MYNIFCVPALNSNLNLNWIRQKLLVFFWVLGMELSWYYAGLAFRKPWVSSLAPHNSGLVIYVYNPASGMLRQEYQKFKNITDYKASLNQSVSCMSSRLVWNTWDLVSKVKERYNLSLGSVVGGDVINKYKLEIKCYWNVKGIDNLN